MCNSLIIIDRATLVTQLSSHPKQAEKEAVCAPAARRVGWASH